MSKTPAQEAKPDLSSTTHSASCGCEIKVLVRPALIKHNPDRQLYRFTQTCKQHQGTSFADSTSRVEMVRSFLR